MRNSLKNIFLIFIMALSLWPEYARSMENTETPGNDTMKDIYLAAGCFWGAQEYFSRLPGVIATESGYAQSKLPNPSYRQVCSGATNAAETVKITYDPQKITLPILLAHYFQIIDPFAKNRQGNDVGTQYRTGIYYADAEDRPLIEKIYQEKEEELGKPLAVEAQPLENFYTAEEYHQDYLKKNPGGYCHIDLSRLPEKAAAPQYRAPSQDELQKDLSPMAFHVIRQNGTEPPFSGMYNDHFEPGIYVDVASGEPLFSSNDKFPTSCGWPGFSAPIVPGAVTAREDHSHGMQRIETRSARADSHLGHVFPDGPKDKGGLRYCINSAALRFIPLHKMREEGYGWLVPLIKK